MASLELDLKSTQYFDAKIQIYLVKNQHGTKSVTSVRRPKMKRDAGVNAVFFLSKKTAFTPSSLFIFGQPTDVMALVKDSFTNVSAHGG